MDAQADAIIARFEINEAGKRRVARILEECTEPGPGMGRYLNYVLGELSIGTDQGFPYLEIRGSETVHGRPVVITLPDDEYRAVYMGPDE